jgi:hypothetical protein
LCSPKSFTRALSIVGKCSSRRALAGPLLAYLDVLERLGHPTSSTRLPSP